MKHSLSTSFGLLIVRIPLGILFILAGWNKIFSMGVGKFVAYSSPNLPHFLPSYIGKTYLYVFPFLELSMGLFVLLGFWTRVSAFILSFMLCCIIYSVTGVKQPPMPFHPNVIFLAVALLLFLAGGGSFTIDRFFKASSRSSKSPQS